MAAPTFPGIAPSGDTRCPAWCDQSTCFPEICHRSYEIEVDTTDATISLSVRQWRNGYPDELEPGWQPAHLSYHITHKTEMVDDGYEPGEPIVIWRSRPPSARITAPCRCRSGRVRTSGAR